MIKKRILPVVMILAAFLLQTTVFQSIKLAGAVPNLLLVLTITYGYLRGRTSGLVIGFFSGLLLDCLYGSVIGLYAFIFMTIGFVVGFCKKIYFTDSLILPVVLIASSDFVYCFHLGFYFIHKFLPEILYTTLAGVLLFELAAHLEKPKERKRKEI